MLPNCTNRRKRHILLLLRINGAQLIRLESLTVIPLPMIEQDEHIYGQENVLKRVGVVRALPVNSASETELATGTQSTSLIVYHNVPVNVLCL